ncbi:MAG: Rpn family recombination-promoting nuclease/putative transposase [Treponema sp.]|nr:Rpn family recombination-promoting nuclease/putative transposase [Treponema sp.]
MDIFNDISFVIGEKLVVLVEHQSTINPNMALRLLFYISDVYESMIDSNSIYSEKQLSIPWPEFFVLYNGQKPFPDKKTVKLSDLFENPKELGLPEKTLPFLELEVKVINIKEGKNEDIVNRCKRLQEYSMFIAKAHAFWEELGNLKEGIKTAIKYCRKHDILSEFLVLSTSPKGEVSRVRYSKEVLGMLYAEWNMEDALAYARKESWEECSKEKDRTTVRNLLAKGSTLEFVQEITGLSLDEINRLKS